jgi:DNA-binding MarR family transcriptional regulator
MLQRRLPPFINAGEIDEDRARLFGLGSLWRAEFEAICQRLDVTPQQAATLMIVGSNDGTPMRKVAVLLGADASNVTGLIDRLETAGLVERYAATDDRRVKRLRLTAAGRTRWTALSSALHGPPSFMDALHPEARQALRAAIDTMIGAAESAGPPKRGRDRS